MDIIEAIKMRRSIRRFTDAQVDEDDIRLILDAARLAPSPTNQQPWHFIVVRDRQLLADLKDVVNVSLDAYLDEAGSEERRETLEQRRFFATHIFDAPVVITVLTRPLYSAASPKSHSFHQEIQSVGAAVENLSLAATGLGYGSCWTVLPLELAYREIESILGVREPWYAVAMVSVGIPAETPAKVQRKSLEEITTFK